MNVVPVEPEHQIKVLRPNHFDACPDAVLPAPRREQHGAGHDRRRDGPILEIACLGGTLHTWQAEAPRALRADSATSATTGSAYFSTMIEIHNDHQT